MTEVPLSIRLAEPRDASVIAELTRQLGYDVATVSTGERLSRMLGRPDHRVLVAEVDGRVVGWLHAAVAEYLESGPFVVIGGLVVDRTHRRHGVGTSLMRRAEAWAGDCGCPVVRLWSSASRAAAHRFYEQLGYRHVKTQYSFVKPLSPAGHAQIESFVPRVDP